MARLWSGIAGAIKEALQDDEWLSGDQITITAGLAISPAMAIESYRSNVKADTFNAAPTRVKIERGRSLRVKMEVCRLKSLGRLESMVKDGVMLYRLKVDEPVTT